MLHGSRQDPDHGATPQAASQVGEQEAVSGDSAGGFEHGPGRVG
jgi:hypothetical protein